MINIQSKIVSTVDAVADALEQDIYSTKFEPGEGITESALSQRYGVSRNTIREATARLINMGLLEKVINKGIYIKKITFEDVEEIFHLRKLFEVEAVVTIDKRGVIPNFLTQALDKIKRMDIKKDWDSYVTADFDFHAALIDAAGSSRLSTLYNTIGSEVKLCIYQSKDIMATQQENAYDHSLILHYLSNKHIDQAINVVKNHIDSAVEHFERGFKKIHSG